MIDIAALRLRPDYHCSPLWLPDGQALGEVGPDIDPDDLPLSPSLKQALWHWAAAYDRTLNQEYPPESGFPSRADAHAFQREGERLWNELRRELPATRVSYFDVIDNRLYE